MQENRWFRGWREMLEMILSLMPRDGSGLDENWIKSIEIDCARTLGELLALADDARIEGRAQRLRSGCGG